MLTRRRFLATSVAATSVPFLKANASRADKLRVAVIGVANRGAANLAGVAHEEIVALCDVDPGHAVKARSQFPNAAFFTDYRKMFDAKAKEIDAVVVSTPDHTHAHAGLLAMSLGKPLYCEKPLARSVGEVRRMREAAKKYKVVTQMGTQIHAEKNYRRVVEIVQSGLLGPIETVHVWLGSKPPVGKVVKGEAKVPFDLDVWRGPTTSDFFLAQHPGVSQNYAWPHYHWRYWWNYGGGQLADFGCHFMDLPFWALNLGAPTSVVAAGEKAKDADNTVPATMDVTYRFPGVTLHWSHGMIGPKIDGARKEFKGFGNGVLFVGKKGSLVSDYSKYKIMPDEFAKDVKLPEKTIADSIGHHKEWLAAIRSNGKALCNFEYSGNLAEAVLLGNAAYILDTELQWDAAGCRIANRVPKNDLIDPAPRVGWEYPS